MTTENFPAVPTDAASARSALSWMVGLLGDGFHPDTSAANYADRKGEPTFTEAEAATFDAILDATHEHLDDIYIETLALLDFDTFNAVDHDAVLDAMSDAGLDVSWEYPGLVAIRVSETVRIWTGLHSYAYGDIDVLTDGEWGPETHADAGIAEYETDPSIIAAAWAARVAAL